MGIVIGQTLPMCSNPSKDTIKSAIAGYVAAQDISARDWQIRPGRNMGQWCTGKAMDGSCPLASNLVTVEEFPENFAELSADMKIGCSVNDVVKQNSSLNQLVFKPADLIQYITKFFTLLPGDIILTGTPPGVGCFRKPPEYLKRGDVIKSEIEGIGSFAVKVV